MTKEQQGTLKMFAEALVEANRKMWEAQEIAAAAQRDFEGFIQKNLSETPAPTKRKYTRKKSLVGAADSALDLKEPGK